MTRTFGAWTLLVLIAPLLGVIVAFLYVVSIPAFIWRAFRGADESWWNKDVHQGRYKND